MKIAIFSDLHDDWHNLDIFLDYCRKEKIATLIFCGDLANGQTLEHLAYNFSGKILMVGGNADLFGASETKKYPQITFAPQILSMKLAGLNILAIHKPKELREFLARRDEKPAYAFHGHTHRPALITEGQTTIANPGTLNGPPYQASFAILDSRSKALQLKVLSQL